MRFPGAVCHAVGIVKADQAKRTADAYTHSQTFFELHEIEVAQMVIAIARVKESHTYHLISGYWIAQFCREDDGAGSTSGRPDGAIWIASDAISTSTAQIELFVWRSVFRIAIRRDVGKAPFRSEGQLFPGFCIPIHLCDLFVIVKVPHKRSAGHLRIKRDLRAFGGEEDVVSGIPAEGEIHRRGVAPVQLIQLDQSGIGQAVGKDRGSIGDIIFLAIKGVTYRGPGRGPPRGWFVPI